jgi:hypothetical protein
MRSRSPFDLLRRRAERIQRTEDPQAVNQMVRLFIPLIVLAHRTGHAIVARQLELDEPEPRTIPRGRGIPGPHMARARRTAMFESQPNVREACAGVRRVLRGRTLSAEKLAVVCAGQVAECLALGLRFQKKVLLAPDLRAAAERAEQRELMAGWALARRILIRELEALAAPLAALMKELPRERHGR